MDKKQVLNQVFIWCNTLVDHHLNCIQKLREEIEKIPKETPDYITAVCQHNDLHKAIACLLPLYNDLKADFLSELGDVPSRKLRIHALHKMIEHVSCAILGTKEECQCKDFKTDDLEHYEA